MLIFYIKWWNLQFKVQFEKLFSVIWWQEVAREIYFFIFRFVRDVWAEIWTVTSQLISQDTICNTHTIIFWIPMPFIGFKNYFEKKKKQIFCWHWTLWHVLLLQIHINRSTHAHIIYFQKTTFFVAIFVYTKSWLVNWHITWYFWFFFRFFFLFFNSAMNSYFKRLLANILDSIKQ